MNTALALRQAIWHKAVLSWPMCGLPDVLYVCLLYTSRCV